MNAGKSTALLQAQVSIGGNERYRQACGRCFYAG